MLKKEHRKLFRRLLSKDYEVMLFLIVLLGLILRLVFLSGIGASDDLEYSRYANNLELISDTDYFGVRAGIIYVTALSYNLFGVNDFTSILFVLLTSIGSIILAFYFGKLLFNRKVGLIAAFLLSFFPLNVVYSTKLLTDLPSAFFMSLGVYIFLYFEIKKLKHKIGYLISGVSIGIGYLLRESILIIGLFFVAYIIYKRRIKKEYFLVPLGVFAIMGIEFLAFFSLTGDPLFRFHTSQQYLSEALQYHNYFGRLDFPSGLFHYPWLFLTNNLLVFFYIFIFLAISYAIIYKKKDTYNLLFWFIPLLLYLSFGSSGILQYIPFRAIDRYTSIITIPGILLLAFFLGEQDRIIKRFVMPTTLALLLLTSLGSIHLYEGRQQLTELEAAYSQLEGLKKTIYIDSRSIKALDYISRYNNKIDVREYVDDLSGVEDSYVVVNKKMIRGLKDANDKRKFPEEIENPPEDWVKLNEFGMRDKDKVIIYYIPKKVL